MDKSQQTVFVDDEVASLLLDIVQEAKKYVIIVTPYLKLWHPAEVALGLAVKKGVKVRAIVRRDPEVLTSDSVAWLAKNGVKVLAAEYLHAKIYLNEHAVVISSMNLTESSAKNSLEIALAIRDEQTQRQVRDYVENTLMRLAIPSCGGSLIDGWVRSALASVTGLRVATGFCIRCGQPIDLDPSKPLCEQCFKVWADYSNENYRENYCHFCGKPSDVNYARPLCRDCFRKQR